MIISTLTPKLGDYKTKKRFAFIPKKVGDKVYFLRFYSVVYVYGEIAIKTSEIDILHVKKWIKISE